MAFTDLEMVHIRIFRRIDRLHRMGQRGRLVTSLIAPSVVERLMDPANQILTDREVSFLRGHVEASVSALFEAGSVPKIKKPIHEQLAAAMRQSVSRYVLYPSEHRSTPIPRGFGVVNDIPPDETVAACLQLAAKLCVERAIIDAALQSTNAGIQPQ